MRTTDEQVNEVFRRAALLRARRLRRKKILLGVCCFALSFHLILLLKGRISMTVATNTATYGSLVFEGIGNHYVLIAVAFFLLGIPAGLGGRLARPLVEKTKDRTLCSKMDGTGECFPSSVRGLTKGVGRVLLQQFPRPLFSGIGLRRVLLFC